MHVHFINSLRNRNPGAMDVGVPIVDDTGVAERIQPKAEVEAGDSLESRTREGGRVFLFKNREPKWNPENQM
jgi:hypothetical protein